MKSFFSARRAGRAVMVGTLLAAGVVVASFARADEPIVMKLGHTLAPDNHYQLTAQVFAKEVVQRTHGKVRIEIFPQSQLGGEVQMAQALRTGTQELMISAQAPIGNTIKQWQIFDTPYLFSSIEDANRVLQGPVGRKYLDMMPHGQHDRPDVAVGGRTQSVHAKKPVGSLGDMKDMKVRVMQSRGYIAGYKALGANPTPLPYNQLFLALSQGLVDGGDTSPGAVHPGQILRCRQALLPDPRELLAGGAGDEQERVGQVFRLPIRKRFRTRRRSPRTSTEGIQARVRRRDRFDEEERHPGDRVNTAPWAQPPKGARDELIGKIPDGPALYQEINTAKQVPAVASK